MPKNIALFIDGTWNEPVWGWRTSNTNVRKLFMAASNQPGQSCHYLRGIGTDPARFAFLDRLKKWRLRNLAGGVSGLGMSDRIKDAYEFLSAEYERGDHVYLFGFSRGAFAARSLAGFVNSVGLLFKEYAADRNLIESAYALYENREDGKHSALSGLLRELGFPEVPSAERGDDLPIYFIGVWDTVATLGLPRRARKFSAPFTEFHQTSLPPNVSYARHALALHELRHDFPALLWNDKRAPDSKGRPRVQQIWFPGAHANVGGGCEVTAWSDAALDWMAGEARAFGLILRDWPRTPPEPSPRAMIDNSFVLPYSVERPVPRASVVSPSILDADTLATFDVHPFVAERLFKDAQTRYQFRSRANDALRAVDWLTVRLIHLLRATRGLDDAIDATLRALEPAPQDVTDCRATLEAFAGGHSESAHANDALLRSFMFSQFQSVPPVVAAEVDWVVKRLGGGQPEVPNLDAVKAARKLLKELVAGVEELALERTTPKLPADPLRAFLDAALEHTRALVTFGRLESVRRSALALRRPPSA